MIDRHRAPRKDWPEPRIRVGAVSYLNSKPLIEGLALLAPEAELLLDYPSRLADDLARGRLDVALIPSVEAFSDPDYEVASDACVATQGAVHSVKLFSRVHPGEIQTLALDEGSRTSAALTRIMLDERFGVRPQLQTLPLGATLEETTADAVLLIGDRAMSPPELIFHTIWDLGEEWVRWTGLPFVFAMWVTRKDAVLGDVAEQLAAARDMGLRNVETIARRGAEDLDLPLEMVRQYLTQHLHFTLGPAEQMGLRLFQDLAARHGLAGAAPLAFRGERPSVAAHASA
jgi:chorismate dehydratase